MPRGDRWLPIRSRRLSTAVAAAVLLVVVLAGCGGSGSIYVANRDEGAFFKLPKDWQVVEIPPTQLQQVQELSGFADILSANVWARIALPEQTTGTPGDDLPLIRVITGDMTREVRDRVSLQSLRALIVNGEFDPLSADALKENSSRLLGFEEIAAEGMRGFHTRLQIGLDTPETSSVIDQRVLVSDDTTTLIFMDIRCRTKCFTDNVEAINKIVESWQVRRP
jgi:hypothetical protein